MYIVEQVQRFQIIISIGLRKATNVFGWGFVTFLPAKSTS